MNYHHHRRRLHVSSFSLSLCIGPPPTKPHLTITASLVQTHQTTTTTTTTSNPTHKEPSSPKISCMGQIKTQKPTQAKCGGGGGFTKLRRIFSERTMSVKSPRPRPCARVGDGRSRSDDSVGSASVADMDPPLPVVRRGGGGERSVSLWKRRTGSVVELELEGLQLQQQRRLRELLPQPEFVGRRRPTARIVECTQL